MVGLIPGKHFNGDDKCYYSYEGNEYSTKNFILVKSQNLSDKPDDKPQGEEQGKKLWCAVASTPFGTICGKADAEGNCWFPHGHQPPT